MGNANLKGNDNSKLNETAKPISEIKRNKDANEIMDYVATNYILSMDFESLKKLYNKNYCDNLIVLTSDIVQKYFTNTDITYLSDRIIKKDNLVFVNRNDLETIDELEPNRKKDLCNGIAKFYVTIAHIFASIITTVNPIYIYTDLNGNIKKIPLSEKNKIPFGVKTQILKYNICDNRINSLRNNSDLNKSTGDLTINPSVCNINLRDDGQLKTLEDEPGIPELLDLYNDDNYDFENGTFNGMSEQTKTMFQENLKVFYTTFTGNEEMPPEITKFSDIKLRDYNKDGMCNSRLNNAVSGNISNELFMKYAENLKEMISKTNKNRDALMEILNDLFVYFIDEETQSKRIRINPKLNEENLKDVIVKARSAVIKLYLTCEQDYVEGIKIYEAIVEQKILETSQKQIESLKKMSEKLISNDEEIVLPEDKIISENLEKEKILEEAEQKIGEIEETQQPPQIQEQEQQPVIEEQQPVVEEQPALDQQSTLDQQPIIEEQPIQEQPILEQPAIQEQSAIQEQPQVEEPAIQEQPAIEQQPVLEQSALMYEQSKINKNIEIPNNELLKNSNALLNEMPLPIKLELKQNNNELNNN